ncbi:hypothetical protein [Salinimonas sediminis]|uniref:Sulfotransferase family protein n=1 Tax=Salinimonas sediminis TaxID=2303538 RepID=A0A346NQP0_9ALTE|nr:hypothetical protein [Salinimonas sediminis]AXR07847.1 hypothetical protein D0Y50_16675 [Salinimonas sediminis]
MINATLHIGAGKAGSSTIQNFLTANRDAFQKIGVIYPQDKLPNGQLGGDNHKTLAFISKNNPLSRPYLARYRVTNLNQFGEFRKSVKTAYKAQIDRCDNKGRLILSAEQFWSELVTFEEVNNLKLVLFDLGINVDKIIFYIREQASWVNSFLHQKIREGSLKDFSLPFSYNFLFDRLNYLHTASLWQQVFFESKVDLRLFQKCSFVNNDLLTDFFFTAGLHNEFDSVNNFKQAKLREVNSSGYDLEICKATVFWNKIKDKSEYLKAKPLMGKMFSEYLVTQIRNSTSAKSVKLITKDDVSDIRAMFSTSNNLLLASFTDSAGSFTYDNLDDYPNERPVEFNQVQYFEYLYKNCIEGNRG